MNDFNYRNRVNTNGLVTLLLLKESNFKTIWLWATEVSNTVDVKYV